MAHLSSHIILNLTERTYFEYSENYETMLARLFEKMDDMALFEKMDNMGSTRWHTRWQSADKIVFVPENENIKQYVKHIYDKIFPY